MPLTEADRRGWRATLLALAIAAFGLSLGLELLYQRFGELDRFNSLFDADPAAYKLWEIQDLRHPAISTLFAPVAVVAKALDMMHLADRVEVERVVGLLVSPLAQAALVLAIASLARQMGATRRVAVPIAVLAMCSAASVTIGSIPESYGVTAAAVAAAMALGARGWRAGAAAAWITVGAIAGAVTIISLAIVPMLLWMSLVVIDKRSRRDATGIAALCALGMFVGVGLLAGVAASRAGVSVYAFRPVGHDTDPDFFAPRRSAFLLELPVAMANAVVFGISPREVSCVANWNAANAEITGGTPAPVERFPLGTMPARGDGRMDRCVTTAGVDVTQPFPAVWTLAIFGAVALGVRSLWTTSDKARFVALGGGAFALTIVAALWLRHGTDYFLAAPLFVVPIVFALAGPALKRQTAWRMAVLWGLVGVTAVRSANLVSQIIGR